MKALLMHRDRDFNMKESLPWNERALTQDLEVDTLLHTMADHDEFLFDVARKAVFSGFQNDVDTILYRQEIVQDCLKNPAVVRDLYVLIVEVIERARKQWWGLSNNPDSLLYSSIELIESSLGTLMKLRSIAEELSERFASKAFTTLFAMLRTELDDDYLGRIRHHLTALKFRKGVLFSAELGEGNEGENYILRQTRGRGSELVRADAWQRAPRLYLPYR